MYSCKKEAVQENVSTKPKLTFDKAAILKNVNDFSAYVSKKRADKISSLKTNSVQPNEQPYGLQYMQDNYGDPGAAAYYAPQPIALPYYQPIPNTTDDDLNYLSQYDLSQKIHTDLDSYFNVNSALSNTPNVSYAVQNSIDGFSDVLKNLASTELDSYINNPVDAANFNEEIYYAQVKSKVTQAFDNYRNNIGNSIGLTANEQTSLLIASTYASSLVQNVDFRDDLSSSDYQVDNIINSSLKANALKANGIFSSIGRALKLVAKVVAAVIVTAPVAFVTAVIGAAVGLGLTFIDPNFNSPNLDNLGVPALSFLGGAIYGVVLVVHKTRIWNWALTY